MCGCWSGWRQTKRKDRDGFLLFPFFIFLFFCLDHGIFKKSRQGYSLICSFVHSFIRYLVCQAVELKQYAKFKKRKSTRVIIRRVWLPLAFKLSIVKTGNLLNIHQLFLDDLLPSRTCAKVRGYIKEQYGDNLGLQEEFCLGSYFISLILRSGHTEVIFYFSLTPSLQLLFFLISYIQVHICISQPPSPRPPAPLRSSFHSYPLLLLLIISFHFITPKLIGQVEIRIKQSDAHCTVEYTSSNYSCINFTFNQKHKKSQVVRI